MSYDPQAHQAAVRHHRERREARYRAADGWLTLVDRIELEEGDNALPIGTITLSGAHPPRLAPAPGVTRAGAPVTAPVEIDLADGVPFELDGKRYLVGTRFDAVVVRVRDPQAPARLGFQGIPFFELDPAFRVEATVSPVEPPRIDSVATTDGGEDDLPCIGEARFTLNGVAQHLGIYQESGGRLVVPFADPTNGKETYGAGRMLYVERPADGEPWVIDFNLAFNPPCAFNPLVACPMPPRHNRLAVPVTAGERAPH